MRNKKQIVEPITKIPHCLRQTTQWALISAWKVREDFIMHLKDWSWIMFQGARNYDEIDNAGGDVSTTDLSDTQNNPIEILAN